MKILIPDPTKSRRLILEPMENTLIPIPRALIPDPRLWSLIPPFFRPLIPDPIYLVTTLLLEVDAQILRPKVLQSSMRPVYFRQADYFKVWIPWILLKRYYSLWNCWKRMLSWQTRALISQIKAWSVFKYSSLHILMRVMSSKQRQLTY